MTPLYHAARQAFTPLLTPFAETGIDFPALEAAIHRQIVADMAGIVVCDSVGEGFLLTQDERDAVLATCAARGQPHLSIIAGAGTNCTSTTIEQCWRAEEIGADALLVTVPYYSKPTLKAVIEHFRQVAASVSIPIIVDNDPGRTAIDHGPALFEWLAELPMIAGICHGGDQLAQFARLVPAIRTRFLHLSRDDRTLAPFLQLGGHGAISPIANVIPSPIQTMVSTEESFFEASSFTERLAEIVAAVGRDDIAALKEAAWFVHQHPADVRLPLVPVEPETMIRLRRALAAFVRCEESGQMAA